MSLNKVDPEKRSNFLRRAAIALPLGIAAWYAAFAIGGVFARSPATLSGSDWVREGSKESLTFGDKTGVYVMPDSSEKAFSYEEKGGSAELSSDEKVFLVVTRIRSDQLITSNGKSLFYLKGTEPSNEK